MIFFDSTDLRHFVKVSVTEVLPACDQRCVFRFYILKFDTPVVTTNNQFKKGVKASFFLLLFLSLVSA